MADLPEDPVSFPTFKASPELLHLCKMDSLMPSSSRSLQHTKELPSSPSISSILFGEDALTVRAPLREQPPSSTTKFKNCSAPPGGLIHGMATRIWEVLATSKEVDAASTHSALLQNTASTVHIPTFSTATTTYLALPPSLAIEQITALTNTETSTETATFSPSGDEQDLNKSPTTPKQSTESATLIDEDNNMCLVLSSVNTTDPRCDRNKLDATAGLEVSDPTNEIDSSKEAAEIASVNDIVSVASSHAVNLPLDKVFASSSPIFVTGPGTAGASFTSDDDLIHRTRGDKLIKPSLKGTEFEWTLVGGRGKRERGRGPKH
ncbi:hypothetical protein DY000_02057955 [Brassica cretica]|uniref:Uncharacterized protein n=1 Tax=Brassica cretica TaxID=69181 RepID=A0ABQ7AD93_BRACR|nr:hypothetical protein DY000_02057955 [Brassica cretica]